MMVQTFTKKGQDPVGSANLRRQIRTEINARFLRNLPEFKIDQRLPHEINDLLEELDRSERQRRPS